MSKLALIDLDIVLYSVGFACQSKTPEGEIEVSPVENALHSCKLLIKSITEGSGCDDFRGFLSDSPVFRHEVATIQEYKANRPPKPILYQEIKDYLINVHKAEIWPNLEADDCLAILQSDDTVICTQDKDLDQVPGAHYKWKYKGKPEISYTVSEEEGARSFWTQMITGDTSDNIPGLSEKAPRRRTFSPKPLRDIGEYRGMYEYVKTGYQDKYGDSEQPHGGTSTAWESAMVENGRLLWILRSRDDKWELPE